MKKLTALLFLTILMTSCMAAGYRQVSSAEAMKLMAESSDYIILDGPYYG